MCWPDARLIRTCEKTKRELGAASQRYVMRYGRALGRRWINNDYRLYNWWYNDDRSILPIVTRQRRRRRRMHHNFDFDCRKSNKLIMPTSWRETTARYNTRHEHKCVLLFFLSNVPVIDSWRWERMVDRSSSWQYPLDSVSCHPTGENERFLPHPL